MASHSPRTPELMAVEQLVAVPAVMSAARSTGLLDRLVAGPATVDELAAELGLDHDGLNRLCVTLERLGLVHRIGCRWSTTITREGIAHGERIWRSLADVLAGRPRPHRSDDASQAADVYPLVVARLADLYGPAPARLAAALPPVDGRILDVGAGAAPWSLSMLEAWPAATATLLDLPGVVDVTARAVAEHDATDRVDVETGDMWERDFGREFDLIVVAGVCHLFADERVADLLGRVVRWLAPGGRLVVVDAGSTEPVTTDGAFHDLSLWLRSGGGHRSESTHLRWLVDAGLADAAAIDLDDHRLVAVTATLDDDR